MKTNKKTNLVHGKGQNERNEKPPSFFFFCSIVAAAAIPSLVVDPVLLSIQGLGGCRSDSPRHFWASIPARLGLLRDPAQ